MKTNEIDQVVQLVGQMLHGNNGNRITVELQHGIMYLLKENMLRWPQQADAEPHFELDPGPAPESQHG